MMRARGLRSDHPRGIEGEKIRSVTERRDVGEPSEAMDRRPIRYPFGRVDIGIICRGGRGGGLDGSVRAI